MKLLLIFLFSFFSIIQVENKSDKPVWMYYGGKMSCEQEATQIAEIMGFKFERVAGCEVTEELVVKVNSNNKKTNEILAGWYGVQWQKLFQEKLKKSCINAANFRL